MENGLAIQTDGALEDRPDDTPEEEMKRSTASSGKAGSHRRTLSNTILSRLSFLRTSQEETRPTLEQIQNGTTEVEDKDNAAAGSSQPSSLKTVTTRKRKGSLRKAALLGTGKLKSEGRERRNSILQRNVKPSDLIVAPIANDEVEPSEAVRALPRTFSYELPTAASSSDSSWSMPSEKPLSLNTADVNKVPANNNAVAPLASPIKSPTQSYASTTDEEEALSFSRPANGHLHSQALKSQPSSSASSYFPPQTSLTRRRSNTKPGLSPLSALPMDAYSPEEEWDYSATEWWGWVVLIVTWIVFVVGMGSCLEVWSWAWDVGQTPYAPPELEDDPTLPIVGYYPALIILTAVMAWVWVVVAWVGMKYFKHAKIQGEDT